MKPSLNLQVGLDSERFYLSLQLTLFHWELSYIEAYGTILAHLGPLSLVFYRPRKLELDTDTEAD